SAIASLGQDAGDAFVDFFTAQIRNPNTRAAYGRNVGFFLSWLDEQGIELKKVQPFHVAAYIELLGTPTDEGGQGLAVGSVKQHLASIRRLCDFLVIRQVLPRNPTTDVRGPKQVLRVGKTPILNGSEAKELFDSIDPSTPAGLRDRAFLGAMVYTFGRVSAVLGMDIGDYYQVGRSMRLRLLEKGGISHEMPAHHTLIEYLDAYIESLGVTEGPLFRTINRQRTGFTTNRFQRSEAWAMVKRRTKAAGLGGKFSNHTFRGTGITSYLKNGGALEQAQYMAAHANISTTRIYDRREQEASLDEVERIIL
ncbi:MAG: tyrosine-type recombinase/integrase, partial [Planctomycetota bacterium]